MDKRLFYFPLLVFVALLAVELVLELRHYMKGFSPPIIQWAQSLYFPSQEVDDEKRQVKITAKEKSPFSRTDVPKEKTYKTLRIWISSASHAIMGASSDEVFPARICSHLAVEARRCEVLNGSAAGEDIEDNLNRIRDYGETYSPDVIVLYQMSQNINGYARNGLRKPKTGFGNEITSNPIVSSEYLDRWVENTSAYGHLREYVSGYVVLNALLDERLPDNLIEDFENKLIMFFTQVREVGSVPVLSTFAGSHIRKNINEMPMYTRLTLMRYQQALSVKGWVMAIEQLNEVVRTVAQENDVLLIDLAEIIGGQPELFRDFVHFNQRGHDAVAKEIAGSLRTFYRQGRLQGRWRLYGF